eukprot:762679-Hanusia_phi.AAC.5
MGDNGHLYVPQEIVSVYRDEVVPKATILTPNQVVQPVLIVMCRVTIQQFEAEVLTGVKISDLPSALTAIDNLHERGVQCLTDDLKTVIENATATLQVRNWAVEHAAGRTGARRRRGRGRGKEGKEEGTTGGADDFDLQAVLANTVKLQSKELQLIYSRKEISDPQVGRCGSDFSGEVDEGQVRWVGRESRRSEMGEEEAEGEGSREVDEATQPKTQGDGVDVGVLAGSGLASCRNLELMKEDKRTPSHVE